MFQIIVTLCFVAYFTVGVLFANAMYDVEAKGLTVVQYVAALLLWPLALVYTVARIMTAQGVKVCVRDDDGKPPR